MNIRITFTFLLAAFMTMSMSAQVIWGGPGDANGEFDGGLNDWTTVGLSSHVPDSASNAVFLWSPAGGSMGSLFGDVPIASETAANGAAIFDSDFLDNGGNIQFDANGDVDPSSVGGGSAPCFEPGGFSGNGHSGILTSPTIDCTGEPTVNLRFYSYFRSFQGEMYVDVSNDDGATFTEFRVNEDDNLGSIPGNVINLDISSVAANSAAVRIQFRWTSSYYFWIIDDVSLIALPGNNLAISEANTFYSPANAVQPACTMETDTILFATDISNVGSDTVNNIIYKATVTNDDTGDFVYVDSVMLPSLIPGFMDSTIQIEELWAPGILEEGIYRINHTVYSLDNMDDFDPTNNSVDQLFEVSATTFAKELSGNGAFGAWPDGGFYAVGAFYQFGADCMENFTVASIDYAVGRVGDDTEPLVGRPVEFWLWKLTVPFSQFDSETNYEEDILTISHPSMEFVGFSQDAIDAVDAAADIIVSDESFLNVDADEITPIFEPGATYALFAHWGTQESTSPLHLFVRDMNTTTDLFYSSGWFGGFTGTSSAPILRLQLGIFSVVDDQPLSDEEFKIYPNPATDLINLELNLENASNATITIADITGKVLSYDNLSNAQREVITFSVGDYHAGTYLARIATENGTKTLKFVVN